MADKNSTIKRQFIQSQIRIRNYINIHDKVTGVLLAVFVGALVAYAAIGFRYLIHITQLFALGTFEENIYEYVTTLEWWQIMSSTISGGVIISIIYFLFMGEKKAGAIAEVMDANTYHNTKMNTKDGIFSAITAAVALGTGSGAGREGPVVHLGATLSSWVSSKLHLSNRMCRTLFGCGVAAAISASFNAPIAGVFFALEVILGNYALHAFAPIVISSVTAAIISRIHFGDFPAFNIPDYQIVSFLEFPAFLMLGAVSALVAIIMIKSIFFTDDLASKLPIPHWAKPPIGGVGIGLIAILCPYILGAGYGTTDAALKNIISIDLLIILIVAKIAATSICLAFRYGSGIFSPSILLGAVVGSTFGYFATMAQPDLASSNGLYAIVGMGAVSSAILGAPISTILIIFELTGDYQITLALMAAVVTANLITNHYLKASSFFHLQLKRSGKDLEGSRAQTLSRQISIRKIMTHDFSTVGTDTNIDRVKELLLNKNKNNLFVVGDKFNIRGIITIDELREGLNRDTTDEELTAEMICHQQNFHLSPNDTLEQAIYLFKQTGEERIAVIADDDPTNILGVVSQRNLLRTYNRVLIEADQE
ncbi:chloride channel protein [Pseudemcibacter aquimaris]|uniref:chloride channel protein n=1 Tax=Pseudemcibacter aquimaris TaxID=2857064 RepID=UPI002011EC80|nr:chloride channel protein [Pseudemcibacter aquimaris]MCC3861349.1 chloride channel protein [Pseudemcibacter aquimaris]WDU58121.1 chloride channel protein [Pseudemcibacter aquimaris]